MYQKLARDLELWWDSQSDTAEVKLKSTPIFTKHLKENPKLM